MSPERLRELEFQWRLYRNILGSDNDPVLLGLLMEAVEELALACPERPVAQAVFSVVGKSA
ncbi:MAG: hypothetical protein AB1330_01565 [Bacillota bacterium]